MVERSRTYQFKYMKGQSAPYNTIGADSDADFYRKLVLFERGVGGKLVPGSIRCTVSESYTLPDPQPVKQPSRQAKAPQFDELRRKGSAH